MVINLHPLDINLLVESTGVVRKFYKFFLTSAAVWLFVIRTQLISFGSLQVGQVIVFGIVLPLTAIIIFFWRDADLVSRLLPKRMGSLGP